MQRSPNPGFFFKGKDLEWFKPRAIPFVLNIPRRETIYFRHGPRTTRNQRVKSEIDFHICTKEGKPILTATIPKVDLISSNINDMQSILTMNFFKYIDRLKPIDAVDNNWVTDFYEDLFCLTDEKMVSVLSSIGESMTNQTELNFHGAFRIPIELFQSIEIYNRQRKLATLNLSDLMQSVVTSSDIFRVFSKICSVCPELLDSDRFKNYLLSSLSNHLGDSSEHQAESFSKSL